jgi:hypothetical protein
MLKLDDPVWETLLGGYRTPYNASTRLHELESGAGDVEEIWEEFWNELHHQGDIDMASYAVVPHLARICIARSLLDWNIFALVATIEECRLFGDNPPLPEEFKNDYHSAVRKLAEFGAQNFSSDWPQELTQSFLAVAAFAKDCPNTARLLILFSDEEMKEVHEKFFS